MPNVFLRRILANLLNNRISLSLHTLQYDTLPYSINAYIPTAMSYSFSPLFGERKTIYAGKGYFASQDLLPGTEILQIKEPLAYALNVKDLENTCESCLRRRNDDIGDRDRRSGLPLQHSTGCRVIRYCSKVSENFFWLFRIRCVLASLHGFFSKTLFPYMTESISPRMYNNKNF